MQGGFIKTFSFVGLCYLSWTIFHTIKKEKKIKEVAMLRERKLRQGAPLSEEKQAKLQQVDQYLKDHEGMRLVSRMKTEEYFEDKIREKLNQKQIELKNNQLLTSEEADKLTKDIEELQKAYKSINPKKQVTLQDLQ